MKTTRFFLTLALPLLFLLSCNNADPEQPDTTDETRSVVFREEIVSFSDGWTATNFPMMTFDGKILTVDVWRDTGIDENGDGWSEYDKSQARISADGTVLSVVGFETYTDLTADGSDEASDTVSYPPQHDGRIIRTYPFDNGFAMTYETLYTDYEANVWVTLFDKKGNALFTASPAEVFGYDLSRDVGNASGEVFTILSAVRVPSDTEDGTDGYAVLTTEGLVFYAADGTVVWSLDNGVTPTAVLYAGGELLYLHEDRNGAQTLSVVNTKDGTVSGTVPLPEELNDDTIAGNGTEILVGAGYDLYVSSGRGLYGLTLTAAENGILTAHPTQVCDWTMSDIAPSDIHSICILDDTAFAIATRNGLDFLNSENVLSLYRMLPVDEIPQKQEVVLAQLAEDYYMQFAVRDFNKSSDEYRVVIRDYTQYADTESMKLAFDTDIAAGNIPDMVLLGMFSSGYDTFVPTYERSGLFCNLGEVLAADADFQYDDLLSYVTEPFKIGGKQYLFPLNPSQDMVFGHAADFPDGTVNSEEFLALAASWDTPIFGKTTVATYLENAAVHDCVDEENAVCNYDDGYFASLMTRAEAITWDTSGIDTSIKAAELFRTGQVKLYSTYNGYTNLSDYVMEMLTLGGDAVPVGYANRDGVICMGSQLGVYFAITETSDAKAACADVLQNIIDIKRAKTIGSIRSGGYTYYSSDIDEQLAYFEGKTIIVNGKQSNIYTDEEAVGVPGTHIKLTKEDAEKFRSYLDSIVRRIDNNTVWADIYYNEYFSGIERDWNTLLDVVQSRVSIYLSEQS